MTNIISESNAGSEAYGSKVWNSRLHLEKIKDYIKNLLNITRIALGSPGSDIKISHPGVQQFLKSLSSYSNDLLFPSSAVPANDYQQHDILRAWQEMWKTIIEGHGIMVPWERPERELRNLLIGHFQHAIIYDWAIGKSQAKGQSILRKFYVGDHLPANVQLALLAADGGFGVTFTDTDLGRSTAKDNWKYAKLLFQPLSSQPAVEFVARYNPDSILNDQAGSGFEVYAVSTNPTLDPSRRVYIHSGIPVSKLWEIIISGKAPQQFDGTMSGYLNSFPRVQVGGSPGENGLVIVPNLNAIGPKR